MPDKKSRPLHRKKSSAGSGKKCPELQTYSVFVEDNFSAMVRDTRWTLGTYATYEEALDAVKRFVDRNRASSGPVVGILSNLITWHLHEEEETWRWSYE